MIETKEHFASISDNVFQDYEDGLWVCNACSKPSGETDSCRSCQVSLLKSTIEDLRPLLRLIREERIVPVGSHVTMCTLCTAGWLTDSDEQHEATCLFAEIPKWLTNDD